jgi:hypothetical protein
LEIAARLDNISLDGTQSYIIHLFGIGVLFLGGIKVFVLIYVDISGFLVLLL